MCIRDSGLGDLARLEGQRAAASDVVLAGQSVAVARGKPNADEAIGRLAEAIAHSHDELRRAPVSYTHLKSTAVVSTT